MSEIEESKKTKRGFAAMSPEKRRELSSRGGKTAHERGTAHRFDSDSAKRAAAIAHASGKTRHWTPDEAREASRRGHIAKRQRMEGKVAAT